jgi:hypothetical protein
MQAVTAALAALASLLTLGGAGGGATRDELIGTWRGTSLCVNRQALPSCNDEQVIYEIVATPGQVDAITIKSDKIVRGVREPMGEMSFHPDATPGRYVTEIETPRVHVLWHLSLKDGALSGGMTLLPSATPVRVIELRRAQGSV